MPNKCACGCGRHVSTPGHHTKACRERLIEQGIPCPPNRTSPQYKAIRLAVQQHGPQQKAQRANAVLGLAPLALQPLHPDMQKNMDAIKKANSINNPINNPISNPMNGPINSKKRKMENQAKNKQIVQDNPDLRATDKMSDGKHVSIFH